MLSATSPLHSAEAPQSMCTSTMLWAAAAHGRLRVMSTNIERRSRRPWYLNFRESTWSVIRATCHTNRSDHMRRARNIIQNTRDLYDFFFICVRAHPLPSRLVVELRILISQYIIESARSCSDTMIAMKLARSARVTSSRYSGRYENASLHRNGLHSRQPLHHPREILREATQSHEMQCQDRANNVNVRPSHATMQFALARAPIPIRKDIAYSKLIAKKPAFPLVDEMSFQGSTISSNREHPSRPLDDRRRCQSIFWDNQKMSFLSGRVACRVVSLSAVQTIKSYAQIPYS